MTNFQRGLVAWDFCRSEEFSSVSTKEMGAKIRSFSRNSCWMKSKRSSQMGVGARSQPQLCRTFSRARSVVMWDSNVTPTQFDHVQMLWCSESHQRALKCLKQVAEWLRVLTLRRKRSSLILCTRARTVELDRKDVWQSVAVENLH